MTSKLVSTHRGTVYPWHCDHRGHMNVMWYVGKFDEATWNVFQMLGITPSYLREQGRGMVVDQKITHITHKREFYASDVVSIRTAVAEMREKVIRFVHEMRNEENGKVAAVTTLTGVHIDARTRKSCPFPEDVARKGTTMITQYHPDPHAR